MLRSFKASWVTQITKDKSNISETFSFSESVVLCSDVLKTRMKFLSIFIVCRLGTFMKTIRTKYYLQAHSSFKSNLSNGVLDITLKT